MAPGRHEIILKGKNWIPMANLKLFANSMRCLAKWNGLHISRSDQACGRQKRARKGRGTREYFGGPLFCLSRASRCCSPLPILLSRVKVSCHRETPAEKTPAHGTAGLSDDELPPPPPIFQVQQQQNRIQQKIRPPPQLMQQRVRRINPQKVCCPRSFEINKKSVSRNK